MMLLCLLLLPAASRAADGCGDAMRMQYSTEYAERIAGAACNEYQLWFRPFIDGNGRLASTTLAEAESARLADGATEAWRRVALYWSESGLLWRMNGFQGASDCAANGTERYQTTSCRAFLIDQPWSAAFISYVMVRAGVPGFRPSASHVDYVRDAYLHPDTSPFQLLDPATAQPDRGDMLCLVRSSSIIFGYAGLKAFFDRDASAGLNMHCDVVVSTSRNNDGHAYMIGGNVLQSVTMRVLNLNRNGQFWGLPQRTGVDPVCAADSSAGCNFSRQDWVALLKLKALPPLPAATPPAGQPPEPIEQDNCCVNCVVGAVPPVPRCKI